MSADFVVGDVWPLTSPDGIELGIYAIASEPRRKWKPYFENIYRLQVDAPISLPHVTFLYGEKPAYITLAPNGLDASVDKEWRKSVRNAIAAIEAMRALETD